MKAFSYGLMFIGAVALGAAGCNNLSSVFQGLLGGTGTTSEVPSSVGKAIAAAFSTGGSQAADADAQEANADASSACALFEVDSGVDGPEGVNMGNTVQPGTYGPGSNSVTLDGTEDCATDSTNPLAYASFEIVAELTAQCADGTTVTLMPGSAGVFRNNEAEGHFPEIHGTFNVRDNDGTPTYARHDVR